MAIYNVTTMMEQYSPISEYQFFKELDEMVNDIKYDIVLYESVGKNIVDSVTRKIKELVNKFIRFIQEKQAQAKDKLIGKNGKKINNTILPECRKEIDNYLKDKKMTFIPQSTDKLYEIIENVDIEALKKVAEKNPAIDFDKHLKKSVLSTEGAHIALAIKNIKSTEKTLIKIAKKADNDKERINNDVNRVITFMSEYIKLLTKDTNLVIAVQNIILKYNKENIKDTESSPAPEELPEGKE